MNSLSRRSFLKTSLGTISAAALASRLHAARANGYRIFACDWTLQKTCSPDAFELAARIGLDGVQVDFGRLKEGVTRLPLFDEAHQDKILAASAQHKVPIASCALGGLNTVPYKSDPATEQWVLDSIGVMKRLRVPVTLLAFFSKGDLVDSPGATRCSMRFGSIASRATPICLRSRRIRLGGRPRTFRAYEGRDPRGVSPLGAGSRRVPALC